MLYSESSAIAVLGALLNDTTLMSEKYRLTKDDFAPNLFNFKSLSSVTTLLKILLDSLYIELNCDLKLSQSFFKSLKIVLPSLSQVHDV